MTTNVPEGYNTVNPFIITKDARKLVKFMEEVFEAKEVKEAFTLDTDERVLHAELRVGSSTVMLADAKEGWLFTPSFLQIYVEDVAKTLQRAQERGARVVTEPTDFFGDLFSRFVDPWDNLWWVYQHNGGTSWEETPASDDSATWTTESHELNYIRDTLIETMESLSRKA